MLSGRPEGADGTWPRKDARQRYPGRAPALSARLHHPLALIKSKMRATVRTCLRFACVARNWPRGPKTARREQFQRRLQNESVCFTPEWLDTSHRSESAMPRPPQELRVHQALEQALADRILEPPEPSRLRDGQRQSRHLAVLTANAHDELIESRGRTLANGSDISLLPHAPCHTGLNGRRLGRIVDGRPQTAVENNWSTAAPAASAP